MPSLKYLLELILDALVTTVMTPYNKANEMAFQYLIILMAFLLGIVLLTVYLAFVYFTGGFA